MGKLDNKVAIVDVREPAAVWNAIADGGVEALGRLDVVVANAGICAMGKGQTIQSWSDTIDTDLVGVEHRHAAQRGHVHGVPPGPQRADARGRRAVVPVMQAMPVPYIEPQDVSDAVVFLAGDDSRYITGTQLLRRGWLRQVRAWKGG